MNFSPTFAATAGLVVLSTSQLVAHLPAVPTPSAASSVLWLAVVAALAARIAFAAPQD
jgi:hypothetical protein